MFFAIFRNFLVLFYCVVFCGFAQSIDNVASIELGETNFPIERTFTISLIIPNSETRATIAFPDIPGFIKRGTSTSVTPLEINGKSVTSQVITQNYKARAPGRFRLVPFSVVVNGETIHSEGAMLTVLPTPGLTAPATTTVTTVDIAPAGAAFLSVRASKPSIYAGDGVALTLSFFVADNYPYELSFQALDKQLQGITRKIRPANSWEENLPINDLKPIAVVINKKKFREYRLFQSVFFPLSSQTMRLPAVSLQLSRRPVVGPPALQPEQAVFTSQPLTVGVRPLPVHPLRGRVAVGAFQLEEGLEKKRVLVGKSVRYTFSITGRGNIATLPGPSIQNGGREIAIFPPEERHTINHAGDEIKGRKTFTYFIVPHQNGTVSLANHFQWIYFDPQRARYDTLRPRLALEAGGTEEAVTSAVNMPNGEALANGEVIPGAPVGKSLYTGIELMDSTQQPVSVSVLIRSVANVLIILMLVGMVFVLIKR
ncbi:BatD family protein [Spirosoma sp.]|uniref:BatD family protein n=1 Tax=Spirosoma sp. TaxID=1899569 RepID=UPI00260EEE9A|nr:BatD family protein [Spirosoma sp.]MCX6213921.1 BatD family protein [Spirosoma sp.]